MGVTKSKRFNHNHVFRVRDEGDRIPLDKIRKLRLEEVDRHALAQYRDRFSATDLLFLVTQAMVALDHGDLVGPQVEVYDAKMGSALAFYVVKYGVVYAFRVGYDKDTASVKGYISLRSVLVPGMDLYTLARKGDQFDEVSLA